MDELGHAMPEPDHTREHRIEQEIVVDADTSDEGAIGWHRNLDEKLHFPTTAKCVAARTISPLKTGEGIDVVGMAPADGCMKERFGACHGRKSISAFPVRTNTVAHGLVAPVRAA